MPHNRSPKPGSKYYLPKYQYKTVVNFCLQYHELKAQLKIIDGYHSGNNDGMPHGTGISDPVSNDAIRRAEIQGKIDIIESSVRESVTGVLQKYILEAITNEGIGYTYLRTNFNIPIGQRQFSDLRRKVYCSVAKKI